MGKREVLRGEKPACLELFGWSISGRPGLKGVGAGPEEGEPLVQAFKRVLFPKICKDRQKPIPLLFHRPNTPKWRLVVSGVKMNGNA
jgi:hypothetical protein